MTTYRRIAAVKTTIGILRHLADQKSPVPGSELARAAGVPVGTAMCHLVTLEDAGLVQRIGEHWKLGMGLALFWAKVKSQKEAERVKLDEDINLLETGG